jgi:signal transduction histidine kinase
MSSAGPDRAAVGIEVVDAGISPADAERMFEPYVQADDG